MSFTSIPFLFVFLPLFLISYTIIPWRNFVILLFSLIFYSWGEGIYVGLLLITVFINYLLGQQIASRENGKYFLVAGITVNILILGYFKYFGFISSNVLKLSISSANYPHQVLGISFFIFHSISYLIDIYRGDAKQARSFNELILYVSMFPKLIAGPIVRYLDLSESIQERKLTVKDVKIGVWLFVGGLCQKVLISDNIAQIADSAFSIPLAQLDTITAWVGACAYTLQVFFDFSGYSLMAIGLGRIMGFKFPPNFNYPYVSSSITEFWRRWHITLSSWLREYLYIPLGGNRKGRIRTYINLFIVFLLCGLWHGAAWTFVIWGIFHGGLLIIERMGLNQILVRLPKPLAISYTLLMVIVGWVIFRSENMTQAQFFISNMFTGNIQQGIGFRNLINNENLFWGIVGVILSTPVIPWLKRHYDYKVKRVNPDLLLSLRFVEVLTLLFFAIVCTLYIMAASYRPFIYFQF
jgi:alginate O-acetyltransferase complex protein AlgI